MNASPNERGVRGLGSFTGADCHSRRANLSSPVVRAVVQFLFAAFCLLQNASPGTAQTSDNSSRLCMAPYWGGVLAGRTRIEAVIKLFGTPPESLVQGEGTLQYVDRAKSRLVIAKFFDNVAISVDVWDTANYSQTGPRTTAQSTWIDPREGIGRWGVVNLGATPEAVVRAMGKPSSVSTNDGVTVWTYQSSCSCELAAGFTVRFKAGRLISFGVWQEAG
jgi:hypothetical protein